MIRGRLMTMPQSSASVCSMQMCLFITLRMVRRTAIIHVHQQPIPLVEVALTPDLHEGCLVMARPVSELMAGSQKTDRNSNHRCDV
jgi:hypothetical protein